MSTLDRLGCELVRDMGRGLFWLEDGITELKGDSVPVVLVGSIVDFSSFAVIKTNKVPKVCLKSGASFFISYLSMTPAVS